MTPISQIFTIVQPPGGVSTLFVTSIDLYFKTKSPTFGVEIQLRTVTNGSPDQAVLPYASVVLPAANVNVSTTSALLTNFVFNTPINLNTNQQYAISVLPVGGSPDYDIWTAVAGEQDVITSAPVKIIAQAGAMFLPTNDTVPTSLTNEAFKYTVYVASFVNNGSAVYRNANADFFDVSAVKGPGYSYGEQLCVSNDSINLASMTITTSNTLSNAEIVIQPDNAGNIANASAYGTVYFANTSKILLANVSGTFITSSTLRGLTSNNVVSAPSLVSQNVKTTASSLVITVPDASYPEFAVNNAIYVSVSNRGFTTIGTILAANAVNNTLTLDKVLPFSSNSASVGLVKNNASLYGIFTSSSGTFDRASITATSVTANVNQNFATSAGQFLIGRNSGTTAIINNLIDIPYENISVQFSDSEPLNTAVVKGVSGTSNATSGKIFDSTATPVAANTTYEFSDEQRILMSRSNELANPNSEGTGGSSLILSANLVTFNTQQSPFINSQKTISTITHNITVTNTQFTGFYHYINGATGSFPVGSTVWQSNTSSNTYGTVVAAFGTNNSVLAVTNLVTSNSLCIPSFVANATSFITLVGNSSLTANLVAINQFGETGDMNLSTSRYVSKSTVLANNQSAEDMVVYQTAYVPPGTDIFVYGKILSLTDPDTFDAKDWSRLVKTSTNTGFSSTVNRNDYLDLTYNLPTSVQIYSSGLNSNTATSTSPIVVFTGSSTTAAFSPGAFIYLADVGYVITGGSVSIVASGNGYVNGDVVSIANSTTAFVNATFTVTTNATGNVTALSLNTPGSYYSNVTMTGNPTTNTTGSGAGLTVTVGALNYNLSSKFNVRQILSIANTTALVLSSNVSFASGNVAIGQIPNMESQYSAFKYDLNNGVARYCTASDSVFDTYFTFAVKFIPISQDPVNVPRVADMRTIAVQI